MKIQLLTSVLAVMTASLAHATLFSSGTINVNSVLPDGNPVGFVSTASINTGGDPNIINGVSVTLNLSGGYNGDLFGYLVNPNGNVAVLLNRVGTGSGDAIQSSFGYSGAGMNIVLQDTGVTGQSWAAAGGDIHTYGGGVPTPGTAYRPDNGTPGTGSFSALHVGGAQGTWTLFLADMTGGNESTLVNWALDVSVVPEPATWALFIFGGLAGGTLAARRLRRGTV